jgi:hypothetical protein
MLLASDPTRRARPSAALWARSTRRSNPFWVDFTCRSASRRFRFNRRSCWSRWRFRVRAARRRVLAPRRSMLRRPLRRLVAARRRRWEIRRLTLAGLRRGLTVLANVSPAVTVAPTAVSATRCACQPNDFRVLASARARVCAAFLADRLRWAALRLRVATPFWAAAFRCVCVWVAIGNHPFGFACDLNRVPKVGYRKRRSLTPRACRVGLLTAPGQRLASRCTCPRSTGWDDGPLGV